MKTYVPTEAETRDKKWYLVDAENKTLGRLSAQIAKVLTGKHKPTYSNHLDMGDYIIVINAEKIKVTGNKEAAKTYYWHTGYIGGLRKITYDQLLKKSPTKIIEMSVKGMMPKNKLGRKMFSKLKIFAGSEHNMQAQKPEILDIE